MIKRLAQSIREYKKESILTPTFVLIEALMEVAIPMFTGFLISEGIEKQNIQKLIFYALILIVCIGISLPCGILAGKYASIASAGFAKNLRHDMYLSVQKYSFANIDKFSTSSIVTRLTTDVTNVQMAYMMLIRTAIRSPLMMIFSFVATLLINPTIALIFLCVMPILGGGLILIASKAHPIFEHVFHTYDKLNNVVQENLRGIRVVKSFVREKHEEEKFNNVSEDIFKNFSKAEKLLAFNSPLMQTCMYTVMLLIAWIGAKAIVGHTSMNTGQLTSVISYAMMILMSLMMISMIFVMVIISRASAQRIVEVLDEKIDIVNPENPIMKVEDGSVVFDNVSFSYSGKEDKLCLKNINLNIPSGSTVGIVGGTGSSKTSLIQLIPRLYDATVGSVSVGGKDVRLYDIETLRNEVSVVLQKNVLFSGTIKENLRWGDANATDEDIVRVCKLAQADSFIDSFPDKYDTYIEQGGTNVSGGQKQRLCIARALLKKPKILILDDSTSAVDTRTDALIRKAFKEEIPDTTKFIIAQRISSVKDADIIIVLEGGEINGLGNHEELLKTNAIYKEIFESQEKGASEDGNE